MNKKIVDYQWRMHYYKDFLMDPAPTIDKAYACDIEYDNHSNKKNKEHNLERILSK